MILEQFKRLFDAKIIELNAKKDQSSSHLTGDKYRYIMRRLNELKVGDVKKVPKDYRLLKTYELINVTRGDRIEQKLQKTGSKLLYVSHDDLFEAIHEIHLTTGHGARDIMHDKAKKEYANVTKEVLQLYTDYCDECQLKRSKGRKSLVVKPMMSDDLGSRCHVDLIDMQAIPDGDFHFILNYQDEMTKYICLRPLHTKRPDEVAKHLRDIFCTFGAPHILQSNNGREFAKKVVKQVRDLWTECILVHGDPLNASGVNVGTSQDVETLLGCWMKVNNTNRWAGRLRFVQWQQNNLENPSTKKTPHSAMFYEDARLGLKSTNISDDIIGRIESEEDLAEVLSANSTGVMKSEGISRFSPTEARTMIKYSSSASSISSRSPNSSSSRSPNSSPRSPNACPRSPDSPVIVSKEEGQSYFNITMPNPNDDLLQRADIHFETTCSVCEYSYIGNHKCSLCNNFCHDKAPCSKVVNFDHDQKTVVCLLCEMSKGMKHKREKRKQMSRDVDKSMESPALKRLKPSLETPPLLENPFISVSNGDYGRKERNSVITSAADDFKRFTFDTNIGLPSQFLSQNSYLPLNPYSRLNSLTPTDVCLLHMTQKDTNGVNGFTGCTCKKFLTEKDMRCNNRCQVE